MAVLDSATTGNSAPQRGITREERKVIFASSLGTVFEWYDFYLYGSLAAIIAKHFFAGVNETTAFIFALLAFAAGFAVRPFGAIVFGRLGDMIGRKYTFLITIVIMGLSTAVVGILPSYATIGVAAPIILISLRLLQGLALGGEYGGAATYVAEHAPKGRRGFFTAWIQTTATLGLFLSLLVILACRTAMGTEAFEAWGWRIPFLLSILLLAISVYIRMQLNESPVFMKMKAEGKASKAPLTESFARWDNLKVVIMSLLGGTAGQAVVWYTGQFYALFFLLQTLKIDPQTANLLIAGSLLIGTPFFIVFGSLSDRIGRKKIIMAGCIIAALTYFPIFKALTEYGNPDVFVAQEQNPVVVVADPDQCAFQFDPVGKAKFTSSCDIAKSLLAKRAIPYGNEKAEPGSVAQIRIGERVIPSFDGSGLAAADFKSQSDAFTATLAGALKDAGYPEKADPAKIHYPMVLLLLTILVIYVTMVYGPIAAWLVELFPARIRYTSMSLPYHIGNGWFGGFLPTVAFAMVAATGDIYYGLWYPIVIAVMTAVLGIFFLPETKDRDIHHS
ncbi:MFS transporter [Pseudomonas sp. SWI6]|uniref:MFS transporter n=1 Tax=Pseudomonas taiwanensis TaxID=470150 RepID=A0ABR6V2D2_9PSED|nr:MULTISPECIES: MFS transporter [Pseudomonas]AGZ35554.1 general substrate transporter [Pseudomonas sp. VLB120]AVD82991.1 MFS transporter [Pseudomonas sp. SWI6]AVD90153.1 MFS transporter [Pseudomonas sp. SWI44]MBC3474494.1 MFS transporter [Pseudomonas taiwanensis]MBC3489573.1 MFS transporter [Pseudomonas taiwanensis]